MKTESNQLPHYQNTPQAPVPEGLSELESLLSSAFQQLAYINENNRKLQAKANELGYYSDPKDRTESGTGNVENVSAEYTRPTIVDRLVHLQHLLVDEVERTERLVRHLSALV